MKFLRRESERGEFQQDAGRPPQSSSKRMMSDSLQGSPEPTPVVAASAPPSVASTPSNVGGDSSNITTQTPDNVIGETLVVQGRVEFQKLLRIDGHFEGELVGNGSLIIGPTAEVISNLKGLNEVYVEGILIGDCSCNKMQIRFAGCVTGNLMCASLGMDPSVVLKGSANINPREKFEKPRSKTSSSRHRQQSRSQGRGADDSSSRASTSALSPESVGSRASGHDKHHQKQRSRGSGDLRPEGARPEGHRRGLSGESNNSSVNMIAEDTPLPHPPVISGGTGGGGGDLVVPKLGPGDAVKMPVRASVPARTRPPVHVTNPTT
ncbi:unnamed protein product [Scytosiphon promiscuus]